MANISITETDSMDLLEQRGLVDLFIKELKKEQGQNDIINSTEVEDEDKRDNKEILE